MSCHAESYCGTFKCEWRALEHAFFRARIFRRWVPPAPRPHAQGCLHHWPPPWCQHWLCCAHSGESPGAWQCTGLEQRGLVNMDFVEPGFCPFAEEMQPLVLELQALTRHHLFEDFRLRLFLRDIGASPCFTPTPPPIPPVPG